MSISRCNRQGDINMARTKKAAGASKPGAKNAAPRARTQAKGATPAPNVPASARVTKADTVLALLRDGATCEVIMKATGWQAHSVRGFISGTLRKKMGLVITKTETGYANRRAVLQAQELDRDRPTIRVPGDH